MNRFKIAGCIVFVALFAAAYIQALIAALEPAAVARPRLLFIEAGAGEREQRTLAGARDAAHSLGVELEVATPGPDDIANRQAAIVQRINPADYAGVAFCPAAPESQIDIVNNLARKTKLVTLGTDCDNSQRLSHIGFSQTIAGGLAARVVRYELSRQGKVALLTTKLANASLNSRITDRLDGFKQELNERPTNCSIIEAAVDSNDLKRASDELRAMLADPKLVFIVAFDAHAAESAMKILASLSGTPRVPIITFDPTGITFDAIDDGRVGYAIFDDPYLNGFTAITRLVQYCRANAEGIPVPGRGLEYIASELVRKENIADFRKRLRS
jgi:ABC-type sugar transport system substrate-binding protein